MIIIQHVEAEGEARDKHLHQRVQGHHKQALRHLEPLAQGGNSIGLKKAQHSPKNNFENNLGLTASGAILPASIRVKKTPKKLPNK